MIRAIAFAVFAAVSATAHALQATDDRGITMSLVRPASRIVTLAPHLAEIAFAAGADAKLAGVSSFSRHPAEAERLPVVASYGRVDVERLIALRPDLVLAWRSGNSALQIDRLERIGIRVFVTEARSLADIPRIVRLVGALAGSAEVADARARQFENEIADLRKRHAAERRVAVFLEIWHAPALTVNGAHLISDALRPFRVAPMNDDGGPFAGECARNRLANTAAAPGDEGPFVAQVQVEHRDRSLPFGPRIGMRGRARGPAWAGLRVWTLSNPEPPPRAPSP